MNKDGVLHHKIKFNDKVYLVDDINELLANQKALIDAKQDKIPDGTYQRKLVPGRGIEIKEDGTINNTLAGSVGNRSRVKNINQGSGTYKESSTVVVDDDYHIYYATVNSHDVGSFTFTNLIDKAGDDEYCIELWIKVYDPTYVVRFSQSEVVMIGDTDYKVKEPDQIIHFVVVCFNGKIYVNKYLVA